MAFIDPYILFELSAESPEALDKDELRRMRRKLLTQIELEEASTGKPEMRWQGQVINRNQVLRLAEDMESGELRQQYWAVNQLPLLKAFLKAPGPDTLDGLFEMEAVPQYLLNWATPLFIEEIVSYQRQVLNQNDLAQEANVLRAILVLQERNRFRSLDPLLSWMGLAVEEMKRAPNSDDEPDLALLTSDEMSRILHELNTIDSTTVNIFVDALLDWGWHLLEKERRRLDAKKIAGFASNKCPALDHAVLDNLRILNNRLGRHGLIHIETSGSSSESGTSSGSGNPTGPIRKPAFDKYLYLALAILVVRVVLVISRCS